MRMELGRSEVAEGAVRVGVTKATVTWNGCTKATQPTAAQQVDSRHATSRRHAS